MYNLKQYLIDFCRDEEGLTTVEYAIAGALIALGVVTAFTNLGDAVGTAIGDLETAVETRPATGG
ncbi:Flp family type IVb pilin [Photobacterium lipolyticum]|uniref:Flp family type IVb pilin n=1 Tax=Photobacterium lipolyticum TaxID=266810 RepID=A0A2T3MYT4_9GAMM|nr:Flp family type IVb pilin [Photobacterium lipolyticum]PSW05156.1 Flp family type IVb pilin [Photobacterium lipolyticum]